MIGTLVNVGGIILGSLIGLLLKKGIPDRVNEAILKMEGFAIAVIGLNGMLSSMLTVNTATGKIESGGGLLLLVSLVVGCLCGEFLRIDDRFTSLGMAVEARLKSDGFARGFITASLIYAIGAMSVIGPITEALSGDRSVLYIKTLLDGTTSIFLASALGGGVLFSCVPVFVVQAIPALLAAQLAPYISDNLLSMFCMVGYALVVCIGLNFLCDTKIKVANLLPALLVPIVYYFAAAAYTARFAPTI